MATQPNDWLVVFRMTFDEVVDAAEIQFSKPDCAHIWRFGPENVELLDIGLPIFKSKSWGGLAVYEDYCAAAKFAGDCTRFIDHEDLRIKETWSAVLQPVRHVGEVNWRAEVEASTAIACSGEDPGGHLVVITSAGFNSQDEEELPRISRFTTSAPKILTQFKQSANFLEGAIFYSMFDQLDGITITMWPDDASMRDLAYGAGLHGDLMRTHRHEPMADRISNTRARVIATMGTWDGKNPLAGSDY